MIDLYTWSTPNGRKVSIALEELGVGYRVHAIDIGKGEQFAPSFAAISPNSKIPVIVDDGRALMESGAILVYLAEKYGRLGGRDRWTTLQWLMLQMASIGPVLGQTHHFVKFNPGKAPYAEARFKTEAARLYGVLDARLRDHEYLADDYSIADIATWPWVSRFEWQQIDLAQFPHVARWYHAIADRPAVQRGYDVPTRVNPIPRPPR
ncbi:MAG TPA: glutathione S-transferase N-terminal domain-containing protein [Pseudomonadales bacterium]|nr:glutathione S-transferase N-terminal domain-containing protein [Pseudomonadales bacterium]